MEGSSLCKHQRTACSDDRISKLPDEILVCILSLLKTKEAGRSCRLSNRWRNLWKFTSRLNFELPRQLRRAQNTCSCKTKKVLQIKFVTWVDQVLRCREHCSLEEFRIHFDLDASFSEHIDEWIKFMILNQAKRIEIDLTPCFGTDFYNLPNDFFKSASNLSNIMCFRSLTLGGVNVDGELIEYLLSNCPHLEILSISDSHKLASLKVAGPSLPLKYLKICRCNLLESIELCAPSLVTLLYLGKPLNFVIGRNPVLTELHIEGGYNENTAAFCLPQFSSHFSQIETLSLGILFKDYLQLPAIGGFENLKNLVWRFDASDNWSLRGLAKFIMVAPSLQKLTLQLLVNNPYDQNLILEPLIQFPEGLKVIEICGYDGCKRHYDLAWYLVESAIHLEKMVIDPSFYRGTREERRKAEELVADQAVELRGCLPCGAQLISSSSFLINRFSHYSFMLNMALDFW